MQTLFLNIAKLKRKQNNWNDILHLHAVYHSQINNSVQTMYELAIKKYYDKYLLQMWRNISR